MKKIPIGRDFFKDIIEGDFYYVDKTKMTFENTTFIGLAAKDKRAKFGNCN